MKSYKFGIIGCGDIAHKHARAILDTPGCSLVAVCDSNHDKGKTFSASYGALWYQDYDNMLANREINIVCICTPSGLHVIHGIEAARAGKHILVEKPMALTLADADRLIETCRSRGVCLTVVFQNRFKPVIKKLRRAIDNQRFGLLTHANATVRWNRNDAYYAQAPWRGTIDMDGGVLLNQAIHNIDLLQWLMGPVDSLFAYTTTCLRKIEAEDLGVAVLRFKNGALGVIEVANTIYPTNLEESLSIFGSQGTAVISGVKASEIKTWNFADLLTDTEADNSFTGHQAVIEEMVKAISAGGKPLVDGEEGKKALEIILAINESARSGLSVKINN